MNNVISFNKVLIIILLFSFLGGCDSNLNETNETDESQEEVSSETATINESQDANECPDRPGNLDSSNVKQINLDNETTVSGQLKGGQALGYTFEGKEEQKLSYNTDDEFCMWFLTPDNDPLDDLELPTDGSYIVQISIPRGSRTFEVTMNLEDPQTSEEFDVSNQLRTNQPPPTSNEDNNQPSTSNIPYRDACGSSSGSGDTWWPVRGETGALNTVKEYYCGDALIVNGNTQAASFTNRNEAERFANRLSEATGYDFWVGSPKTY